MGSIESALRTIASHNGADLVGIASRESLCAAPPSADPEYLLPDAESVISFAVALDEDAVRRFLGKEDWISHGENRKQVVQQVYSIGDELVAELRREGYEAINVDVNNNYRPEEGAAHVSEMTEFHPTFSHRYAAVAAGIGRLGWSGNLLTPGYGALVELGSVITSAKLSPDAPLSDEDHPCDGCRICSKVCPVQMVSQHDSVDVTVAGVTETISRKQPNTCCWIGCTGYEGASVTGTWGNYSPYRLGQPLPTAKRELDELCIRLQKADPQMQDADNSFADYRGAIFDPEWFYYTVCGFCRSVCWASREDRIANRRLIVDSGRAALQMDGLHVVADADSIEVETPFGLNVVVAGGRDALTADGPATTAVAAPPGRSPLDRAVIAFLRRDHPS